MNQSLPKEEFSWNQIWEKNKIAVSLGLVGMILVGIGVFSILFFQQKESVIEILPAEEVDKEGTIWVDLAGAVMQPGVYELPGGSRLKDLLARAGGLAAEADRKWIEKNLNLAQKLIDGQKVYIPNQSERAGEQESGKVAGVTDKTNINTASASELDTLWGIGEVRAKSIIENRPYASIDELLSKKVIPSNVFEKIKDEISLF